MGGATPPLASRHFLTWLASQAGPGIKGSRSPSQAPHHVFAEKEWVGISVTFSTYLSLTAFLPSCLLVSSQQMLGLSPFWGLLL